MSEAKKGKILIAARSVFLRYGYKRASMNDIATAAGLSRAALYLVFKSKEDVFLGVFRQWIAETIADIRSGMATLEAPGDKLRYAFEIWAVRPFEIMMGSPEAKELVECSFDFAQASLRQGYAQFEATILPVLASMADGDAAKEAIGPDKTAHVLASAVRGFKQTATTPAELRLLVEELLILCLATAPPHVEVRRGRVGKER